MKILYHISFILFLVLSFSNVNAQNQWIQDQQMNFKINVPSNYQTNNLWDGTDKIHAFVSPDQNLVVRVRAIKLNQSITNTQLQALFEQNIINGAMRISDELTDLNGLPARWSGYSWVYNNVNTVLANYYIVQPGMAYVVWAIVAENMVDQKTVEMSNIMGSFSLINGHPQNNQIVQTQGSTNNNPGSWNNNTTQQQGTWNQNNQTNTNSQSSSNNSSNSNSWKTNTASNTIPQNQTGSVNNSQNSSSNTQTEPAKSYTHLGIKVTSVKNGAEIDSNLEINSPGNSFPTDAKKINTVFDYTGNAKNLSFNVKWFSETHQCLLTEAEYLPTFQGKNHVHAYIENGGKAWPEGNYKAEIWYDGNFLTHTNFSIGKAVQTPSKPANGILIGECWTDGTGDNSTKSKGGKYFAGALSMLNDNDIIEIRVISGSLKFVHIHYRNSSGVWYDAYDGTNTRFKVGDLLNGKRNLYTHLIFNVNAKHEKYLPVACSAEIWLIKSNTPANNTVTTQTPPTQTTTTNCSTGVKQIVMDNNNCGYDFKTGKVRSCHGGGEPDVMNEPWCTDNPALCGNWVNTGKSRLQDVNSAPASGYLSDGKSYTDCHECPVNKVLVFKLKDGTYGKFLIIKDDKSKVNGNCQHKITCQVEYPAF